MARVFDSQSMVGLPALDAPAALAVTSALLTAAGAEKRLPSRLARERHRVEERLAALQVELRSSLGAMALGAGRVARLADRREDAAFSALERWLDGWVALPADAPEVERARSLHATLFPDGLQFLRLPFKQEWAEAQMRIDYIDENKLDVDFEALGGQLFLATLREAHAEYGQALGITRTAAPEPAPAVRAQLDALKASLRAYVLQVVAHADQEEPATVAMSERLLAPLASWQPRPRPGIDKPPADSAPPTAAPTSDIVSLDR